MECLKKNIQVSLGSWCTAGCLQNFTLSSNFMNSDGIYDDLWWSMRTMHSWTQNTQVSILEVHWNHIKIIKSVHKDPHPAMKVIQEYPRSLDITKLTKLWRIDTPKATCLRLFHLLPFVDQSLSIQQYIKIQQVSQKFRQVSSQQFQHCSATK